MKRRTKKLFSLLLSLALVVGMIPAFGVVAQAEEIIQISWSQNEIRWTEVPETTHYSISLQWIAADGVHVGETMVLTFYPEGKKGSPDLMIDYDGHSYGMEGTVEKNEKWYILKTKESPLKLVNRYIDTDQYVLQIYSYGGERTGKNITWATGAEINSGSLDKTVSSVNFTNFTLPTNGETYSSDIRTASDFPGKVTRYDFQMYKKSMTGTTASAGDDVGFVVYVDLNDGYEWADSKTAYLNEKPQEAIIHSESMGTECGFMWTFKIGYTDKIKITGQSPETVEYLNGEDVKLFVNATGATGYQWGKYNSSGGAKQQFRPMDIEGATGSTYTISKADSSAEGIYRCTLTCGNGTIYSKDIVLKMVDKKTTNPFVDVTESDYFYEPVLWAVEKEITKGTDDAHFSPNATCTRGQVVTFLWRAAGSPAPSSTTNPFTDVNSSDYYYNAVLWAVGKNITNGTSATTFGPNDGCTRGQVVTFLHRFENAPTPASSTNPFVDVSSSEYYYTPVLWAVGKGITNGTDATHFSPNDTCTRGQIVTFLYRDMK